MKYRMNLLRGVAACIALCCIAAADITTLSAALIKDLSSPDPNARIRARQLLPRNGVAALEGLLPLLATEDQSIRANANKIVADIVNGAASPGHDADRQVATKALMTLVAPEQPEMIKLQGLRLLPIVVPQGFDLGPITALLTGSDTMMREKAREALGLIATNEACDALIDAAAKADAPFATALLDEVANLHNPKSLDRVAALATNADPGVRVAAIRALAWSGKAAYVAAAQDVVAKATPDTVDAANDAMLRLADALARDGGNWDVAIDLYKGVLKNSQSPVMREVALMGLGRYGDSGVIDTIVAATASANGTFDKTATMALTALQGADGIRGVIAVYPTLSEHIRTSILAIWGQQKQIDALDLVTKELSSQTPAVRTAALHALADIGSMKGFAALVDVAKSGNDEEKQFALDAVKKMAGNLGVTGDKQAAGLAYMQLYGLTPDENLRTEAIKGIVQNPVPQAFDVVKDALNQPNLKTLAVEALASVAGALSANKENDKAVEAAKLVRDAGAPPETLVRMASTLDSAVLPAEIANLLGVVRNWQVIGPFDWKTDAAWTIHFVNEPDVDVTKPLQSGDTVLQWKPVQGGGPTGLVDMGGAIGLRDKCFGYAYAVVDVAEEADGQIRLGSDDGNQIWLNGKKVFENRVDRGTAFDQDKVNVHFVKGTNTILAKISQGGGGWNFMLRLAQLNGTGIAFTQP